jgi:hypothetical protein
LALSPRSEVELEDSASAGKQVADHDEIMGDTDKKPLCKAVDLHGRVQSLALSPRSEVELEDSTSAGKQVADHDEIMGDTDKKPLCEAVDLHGRVQSRQPCTASTLLRSSLTSVHL